VTLLDVSLHLLLVSLTCCLAARRLKRLCCSPRSQAGPWRRRLAVVTGLASTLLGLAGVLAAFVVTVTLFMAWWLPAFRL
jgi:hypothetical protein